MKHDQAEHAVWSLLQSLDSSLNCDSLKKTPERVAKAWGLFTEGYLQNPQQLLAQGMFEEAADELILVRDIDYFSMCEHHLLPFFGKCHIGYRPKNKVVGLSKLVRVVDVFSRRLQVQERMTAQIADVIEEVLEPEGVAVVVHGFHTCMAMRGVQRENASVATSAMRGVFRENDAVRSEFLQMLNR